MDLFLHHYPASLFSEKIRAMLGWHGLAWQSVEIPNVMPRPLLMPLSGGYRRTPVLQIGANVYCDTKIIARGLARLTGDERLYREGFRAHRIADWADSQLFQVTVALNFRPEAVMGVMSQMSPEEIAAFQKDRAELAQGASLVGFSPAAAMAYLEHHLDELERSLDAPFLFGDEPTIADFSLYHCLWFLDQNEVNAPLVRGPARVAGFLDRMAAVGHGKASEADGRAALAAARGAEPVDPQIGCRGELAPGSRVSVTPVDYGKIPVEGALVGWSSEEVVVRRETPETGHVLDHFPSPGFEVAPVAAD